MSTILIREMRHYKIGVERREKLIVGVAAGVTAIYPYFAPERRRISTDSVQVEVYRPVDRKIDSNDPRRCGLRIWAGVDVILNYERVVAKPAGQPDAQTIRMTIRRFW
jgi:hypothetical protein